MISHSQHYLSKIYAKLPLLIHALLTCFPTEFKSVSGSYRRYYNKKIILFIYLLTLFNVDYNTLAAMHQSTPQKKHNKNVNKNIKEVNRICTVLSNIPYILNVRFTYCRWTLFTLPFSNFLFKNFEITRIFSFFRY